MTARRKSPVAAVAIAAAGPAVAALVREPWWRAIFTDRNGDFDTGRVLVPIVVITMCANSLIETLIGHRFDARDFGIGVGSVLAGFAAYLFGDAQRPPPMNSTTTSTISTTQGAA